VTENTRAKPGYSLSLNQRRVFLVLLVLAGGLLLAGMVMPMLTLTKFLFLKHSISLVSGIQALWQAQQWLLVVLILLFSILVPLAKLGVLFRLVILPRDQSKPDRWLKWMHDLGRWGMLDVFVVSVLIMAVKLGSLASVQIHLGLYLFGAAVLLMMVMTHWLSHLVNTSMP